MAGELFVPSLTDTDLGGADSDFVIVEWSDSGDSGYEWIAPLHVHHSDDEAWYVLEGTLRFRIADEVFEAGRTAPRWRRRGRLIRMAMPPRVRPRVTCS